MRVRGGIPLTLVEQEQTEAVRALKRQAKLRESIVPMGPADPRLAALGDWHPPLDQLEGDGKRHHTQALPLEINPQAKGHTQAARPVIPSGWCHPPAEQHD